MLVGKELWNLQDRVSHVLRGRYSTPLFENRFLYGLVSSLFFLSGHEICLCPIFRDAWLNDFSFTSVRRVKLLGSQIEESG